MNDTYEIEIKSLLGTKDQAEALKSVIKQRFPSVVLATQHAQLNHYFQKDGSVVLLIKQVKPFLSQDAYKKLQSLVKKAKDISIRTRQMDESIRLVLKASIDDTTSENGIGRIEFEEPVHSLTLKELDQLVLESGFSYQAKWSRHREEYHCQNLHICIDKNAGYGYLAEFERVIHDPSEMEAAKQEIVQLMEELGVKELSQERLQRMFDHYNHHWQDYYGTEKTFTIE